MNPEAEQEMKKYKVIQMGLGAVGRRSAKLIAEKESVELVGAIDIDEQIIGHDVSDVVGLKERTGVTVSSNIDEVLSIPADLVLHMTPTSMAYDDDNWQGNVDEIVRCLQAGKNVITLTGFNYPFIRSPDQASMLDRIAKENNVTIHGTGVNPTYISELLPLVLTGSMQRVDGVRFSRTADHSEYDSVKIARDMLGYGLSLEEFDLMIDHFKKFMHFYFLESIHAVAAGLGWEPPEDIRSTITRYPAKTALKTSCIDCPPGHVCSLTISVEGFRDNVPVITMDWTGVICPDECPPDYPKPGESIWIDGEPSTGVEFTGKHPHDALGVSVAITTNYVPVVVEADPGLKWFGEMPTPVCIT